MLHPATRRDEGAPLTRKLLIRLSPLLCGLLLAADADGQEARPAIPFELIGSTSTLEDGVLVPVPFVLLSIVDTEVVGSSNSAGDFRLAAELPPGDYTLRLSRLGLHSIDIEAPIRKAVKIQMGKVVLPALPNYVGRTRDHPVCGDPAEAREALEWAESRLKSERDGSGRRGQPGILDAVPPGAAGQVVTDPSVCAVLFDQLGAEMAADIESGNAEYAVYRIGPYYFLSWRPDTAYIEVLDGGATIVFDADTLEREPVVLLF
ncbi:MAG: hypothetical protein ACRELV_08835 [Longimicrobiales bacterium]